MVPFKLATTALLGLVFLGQAALAQEPEQPDRWGAEIGLSLNASGGNEELTVLLAETKLTHLQTAVYEAAFGARFRYGRSQGEEVARNLRGNATIDLWPAAGWSPFLFATAERDPFKKLDARLNGGAGVKRTFWQDDWDEVSLSGAVLYSYENLELADSLGDGVSQTARWSWRGRGRLELGEGRRLEQVVFYQPEWDAFDDYLLEAQTSARWALTQSLAFTATLLYQRDSTPPPEVDSDDWTVALGFSLATRW
jgi:hypothetical protein